MMGDGREGEDTLHDGGEGGGGGVGEDTLHDGGWDDTLHDGWWEGGRGHPT